MRINILSSLIGFLKRWKKKYPSCPPLTADKKEIGAYGEKYTAVYLEKRGYTIRDRNLRLHRHELDLVAQKGNLIIFCEVKTRFYAEGWLEQYGRPASGLKTQQIENIRSAAASYVKRSHGEFKYRFDVAEIYLSQRETSYELEKIHYIENAFR